MPVFSYEIPLIRRLAPIWKFDSAKEDAYGLYMREKDISSLRLTLISICLTAVGFLIVDYFRDTDYGYVLMFRGGLIPVCLLFMAYTYRRHPSPGTTQLLIQSILYINLFAFVMLGLLGEMPVFYLPNTIVLLFYMGICISGIRFRYSVVFNLVVLATFLVVTVLSTHGDYTSRIPNVVFNYLLSSIAGAFIEQSKRENFLQYTSLLQQKNELNELDQQKNKIISILSHDITAPLNSLSGLITMCKNKYIAKEEIGGYLPDVERRLDKANFLVNNLVKWSKSQIDGFKADRKPIDLSIVVLENINLFESQAKEKGIIFEVNATGDKHEVMGDFEMIKFIIRNLVSNAVKFSYPNATIAINIFEKNNTLALHIVNRGRPLDHSVVDKLFTFQVQPQAGTLEEKGTGLGLAIAQHFAQLNENRLVYISNPHNSESITFGLEWDLGKPVATFGISNAGQHFA